jgi:hypothetical protein
MSGKWLRETTTTLASHAFVSFALPENVDRMLKM